MTSNHAPRRLGASLAAVLLGLITACENEPTRAFDPAPTLQISTDARATLDQVIGDALGFLIPALENRAAARNLTEAITAVRAALASGGQQAFDRSLVRAQSLLVGYEGGGTVAKEAAEPLIGDAVAPDAPVMAMLRLTLDRIASVARGERSASD